MSVGKYLSLEEARHKKLLKRFAAAHPSTGNQKTFDAMLSAMTAPPKPKRKSKK